MIDSVYREYKNYYPQLFLEKYNFIIVEEKMANFKDGTEIYSDDSHNNVDSDEEYCDDSNGSDKEHFCGKFGMKKIKCINFIFRKNKKNVINLFFKK